MLVCWYVDKHFLTTFIPYDSLQVCSAEEQEILDRGSKKSERLRQQLMGSSGAPLTPARMQQINEGFEKARKHKDKLLEYDKTRYKHRFHVWCLKKSYGRIHRADKGEIC